MTVISAEDPREYKVKDGSQTSSYNLTKRQRQVADLVVRGMTNREIGRELAITEDTVKRHLYDIYEALGINNRVQLVRKLLGL